MTKNRTGIALAVVVLAALHAVPGTAAAAPAADDPWATLDAVRDALASAGPIEAQFTQTYVPAGFSNGEEESGTLALALPDCLRWDYRQPYDKTFLLCGEVAHYWNAEDRTGRRYRVDRENEPGLDLLLLGVDDLKARYRARQRPAEAGRVTVELEPLQPVESVAEATLVVDPAAQRIVGLSYRDREGNSTRFRITGYHALDRDGAFDPPRQIRWQDATETSP